MLTFSSGIRGHSSLIRFGVKTSSRLSFRFEADLEGEDEDSSSDLHLTLPEAETTSGVIMTLWIVFTGS
jgi:hypothetical protein